MENGRSDPGHGERGRVPWSGRAPRNGHPGGASSGGHHGGARGGHHGGAPGGGQNGGGPGGGEHDAPHVGARGGHHDGSAGAAHHGDVFGGAHRGGSAGGGHHGNGWKRHFGRAGSAGAAERAAERAARRAEKAALRVQRHAERRARGWPPPGDDCGLPPPPRRGRQRRVNGPWAMHQLEESDRGPGPAIVAGVAQVVGCSWAAAPVPPIGYALLLLGPVALLLGRRYQAAALLVAVASTVVYEVAGFPGAPTFVAALIALVRAVRAGKRREARYILLAGFVAFTVVGWLAGTVSFTHAAVTGAWTLVGYGFAEANRARIAQMVALAKAHAEEERAAAERERAAEEQKRRQAADERLRIARELHDVLGHHLSLINVQAGVGLHLLDEHPEQAKTALAAIKQASSEALGEVRGVLAALRPEGEAAPKAPAPGLAEVEELTAAAGLPVAVKVDGRREQLPPDLDRAAYRIVQEALTNVRRHAGPAAEAELTLAYSPERLRVRVINSGTVGPQAGPGNGNGIAGMRERATALGGTLRAGPRPGGGFEVVADLPRATAASA